MGDKTYVYAHPSFAESVVKHARQAQVSDDTELVVSALAVAYHESGGCHISVYAAVLKPLFRMVKDRRTLPGEGSKVQ